ncbi:hypothetical protein DFJ74DRAFT_675172 [Hyaloraphidium curvatum]|nr:hypothetical protein DFJ74DRAFT_675172 [Hyaloraphidium curvatum]
MGKAAQEAKKRRRERELGLGPYAHVREPVAVAAEDGDGADEGNGAPPLVGLPVSAAELATASRVLAALAGAQSQLHPSAAAARELKPLRRAVHAFLRAEQEASGTGASLSSRVSLALASGRFTDARVLLAEMAIRGLPLKLGQVQRWVRECDAAATSAEADRAEVWRALEGILRAAGEYEPPKGSQSGAWKRATDGEHDPGQSSDEYGPGAPVFRHRPWTVGDPSPLQLWAQRETGTLFAPDELQALRAPFRDVLTTPGPQRQPPNLHPAVVWASEPGSIPLTASAPVTRHDHPSVPGCFLLRDLLDIEDCRTILRHAEAVGYLPDQPQANKDSILAHNFIWLADPAFMSALFSRARELLPQETDGGRLRGINPRFRCYRYVPGAVYRPHIDGAWPESGLDGEGNYVYDVNGAKGEAVWSRLTFLIYLNDDFSGGCTTFFLPRPGGGLDAFPVRPRAGCALVFPHGEARGSLLHEGSGVEEGGKFVIRTEVLYEVGRKAGEGTGMF